MKGFQGLQEAARALLGLKLTARQLEAFRRYAHELVSWNQRFNLTAITDPEAIAVRHFLDSLTCLLAMRAEASGRLVDVGTGAGFPGIPLKLVSANLRVTLIEATRKKAEFCKHVVEQLQLEGVETLHARAEEVGQDTAHRQAYDWAVARAVAPLPVLVEYLLPFLRIGGRAIAQKGETAHAEVHEAEEALRIFGGKVSRLIAIELPGVPETRHLVVIEKTAATPAAYPRRPGMPEKRPLGSRKTGELIETGESVLHHLDTDET